MKIYKNLLYFLFFLSLKMLSQENMQPIQVKRILVVEVCRQNEFTICSNSSPGIDTKIPDFYEVTDSGEIDYSKVYRIPFPTLDILEMNNSDKLYDAMLNQQPITDSIDICLSKKDKKKIKKYIRKQKTSNMSNISFDGCFTYYMYNVDFQCISGGESLTNVIDMKEEGFIGKRKVDVYYIKKVISIESTAKKTGL